MDLINLQSLFDKLIRLADFVRRVGIPTTVIREPVFIEGDRNVILYQRSILGAATAEAYR